MRRRGRTWTPGWPLTVSSREGGTPSGAEPMNSERTAAMQNALCSATRRLQAWCIVPGIRNDMCNDQILLQTAGAVDGSAAIPASQHPPRSRRYHSMLSSSHATRLRPTALTQPFRHISAARRRPFRQATREHD